MRMRNNKYTDTSEEPLIKYFKMNKIFSLMGKKVFCYIKKIRCDLGHTDFVFCIL